MRVYFLDEKWDTDPDLDGYDRYLLMWVQHQQRETPARCATATQEELGDVIGRSVANVRIRIKRLVEKGALRCVRAGKAGMVYQVVDEAQEEWMKRNKKSA